jgi:Ferritin-like domain
MRRTTRGEALRAAAAGGAAIGAGALLGGWIEPSASSGRPSPSLDARIWRFLLLLEEAQAALYDAALRSRVLPDALVQYARVVAPQEHEHVALIRRRLGAKAGRAPAFDYAAATSSAARFQQAAIDLEEVALAAYIAQGASLTGPAVTDAARIVAVDARHAAWIRDLAGAEPAPRAADPGRPSQDLIADLRKKGLLP